LTCFVFIFLCLPVNTISHSLHVSSCLQQTIVKQLVDALIEVHSKGVFHRDIKLDNILIETDTDVPRVRLIDFGCGTFLSEGTYSTVQGRLYFFCTCSLKQPSSFVVSILYLCPLPLPLCLCDCVLEEPLPTSVLSGSCIGATGLNPLRCGSLV